MDWKEARSDIQFIAGVEFGAFAARAFRISGATVVGWQEGATGVLCRLTASEEQEAQEAIRRGDGERVASICKNTERITQAIGYERQALEWQQEETSAAREDIREAVEYLQEGDLAARRCAGSRQIQLGLDARRGQVNIVRNSMDIGARRAMGLRDCGAPVLRV
jgi:hypothetical protein